MIHQIEFDNGSDEGYAYNLGLFNDLPPSLDLTAGINIFFGPNGCGKSTLLKMMAEYVTCPHSGRAGSVYDGRFVIKVKDNHFQIKEADPLQENRPTGWYRPDLIDRTTPVGLESIEKERKREKNPLYPPGSAGKVNLKWDGGPTYFEDYTLFKARDTSDYMTIYRTDGTKVVPSPILPIFKGQSLGEIANARSRGESTQSILEELNLALKDAPQAELIDDHYFTNMNIKLDERIQCWKKYILSRGPSQGYTFLLDEPEAHLSIPAQREMWEGLIDFSQQHQAQVIASSHSFLALLYPTVRVIDFKKGYGQKCKDTIKRLLCP